MSVLYGIHAALEALKARPDRIERICIERNLKNPRLQEIIDAARKKNVRISFEDRTWMDRKTGGARHQGVLLYAAEMELLSIDDIIARAQSPGFVAVLDGIEDPHNLGAILRSAEAAGCDGVFMPRRRSASLSSTAVKTSAGASSHIPTARVANISRLIESLKKAGYWVAGLDASAGRPIWEIDLTAPVALVLGNEGTGLHRLVREKCDFLVSLPIRGKVSSYNVSVAAGISFYEVLRQRAQKKKLEPDPGLHGWLSSKSNT
ncbi:MAG TPA: 23S rRNA (guanosine(2251)-2'-O)-methyltransferase RlmB [Acidobacteriota bacterium]|nr:23S rRNA (guanosine(2251)-2'-O)-methyltransferase RlmB [Acidobacteriota bacterium]